MISWTSLILEMIVVYSGDGFKADLGCRMGPASNYLRMGWDRLWSLWERMWVPPEQTLQDRTVTSYVEWNGNEKSVPHGSQTQMCTWNILFCFFFIWVTYRDKDHGGMGGGTALPTQHEWRMIIQNMHKSNLKSSEINCFRYPKWPPAVQPCITTPPQKKRRNCKSAPLVTYMIMKSNYCPDSVEMCPFSVKFSWQLSQWHKIWWYAYGMMPMIVAQSQMLECWSGTSAPKYSPTVNSYRIMSIGPHLTYMAITNSPRSSRSEWGVLQLEKRCSHQITSLYAASSKYLHWGMIMATDKEIVFFWVDLTGLNVNIAPLPCYFV